MLFDAGVCIHSGFTQPHGGEKRLANIMLYYTRDLGGSLVRFDIRWSDVEPDPGIYNIDVLAYYTGFLREIVFKGIKPVVIIGTGIPKWFSLKRIVFMDEELYGVLSRRLGLRIKRVTCSDDIYCKAMEHGYIIGFVTGNYVYYYQLGNELNNILINKTLYHRAVEYIAGLYMGLLRAYRVRGLGKPRVVVNVFACIPGWKKFMDKIIGELGGVIDVIGIDYYPGTWCSCLRPYDWSLLDYVAKKIPRGMGIAITETGYPTRGIGVCGPHYSEDKQVEYIDALFTQLLRLARRIPIKFMAWYELIDENRFKGTYEPYFGVLRRDFTKKKGYYRLKKWFHLLKSLKY